MTDLTRREADFLLYQTEDGQTRVEVRFDGETAWLSLGQMAELFQRDKSVISRHIKNLFEEGELDRTSVVAGSATTAFDGKAYQVEYFNLDVIISVGYRVKSHRGTQFRIWATQRLREYIIKGFTLDDERLKRAGDGNYFDELLARIRDVRSSEKVFGARCSTSTRPASTTTHASRHPSGSSRRCRTDALGGARPHRRRDRRHARRRDETEHGLTTWTGEVPRRADVAVAKNYLGIVYLPVSEL